LNLAANDLPAQEPSTMQFPRFFQDATMLDLDIFDDPGWSLGFGEAPMFGATGV
jgi:hypothetical protein